MPQAVTHILIPILVLSIWRDFYLKKGNKKKFPLHYVLIAGLGGVLPDIDILFSVILNFAKFENWNIHKTLTHSLLFPIIIFLVFLFLKNIDSKARICNITRHKLKLNLIFLMLSIGTFFHIILDALFGEPSHLFYPFTQANYALYLFKYLPGDLANLAAPLLDGILLVIWIAYLEIKHKISDFI